MHPTTEEMLANRLKLIPAGTAVRLIYGMFSIQVEEIGEVALTYLSGAEYQCSVVNFPSVSGRMFPNYLLEEIHREPDWEV